MRHGGLPGALWAGFWVAYAVGVVPAAEQPPTPEQLRFFETKVRPLFAEHCYKCHGPDKQRSDLRLDTREGVLQGGAIGPAVVPGRPEESLLIRAVRHQHETLQMPPKQKLADRQIADLVQWVKMGVPYPQGQAAAAAKIDLEAARKFWAFQPPADPPLPAVRDARWPTSSLDHFILAKLETNGLRPVHPADRRTLIRRATYDLTGLPPTPEETDAFLADDSPEAFARVVDRLLSSPAYGERWGRHWLDVARYADSNGLDENIAHGNAWRYRDYVIAAFNKDKPYDQFLLEQLAGDLLPPADDVATQHERLIATGFLSLGPKVLAEVDEKKMEMDIIDEQIDTLGRSVMALTLGCARCHDHKFDPIQAEDYYALAGIFKSTKTMENFKKIARWYENPLANDEQLAKKAAHARLENQKKKEIQKVIDKANAQLKAKDPDGKIAQKTPKELEALYPEETKAELKRLRDALAQLEKAAPELPSAMGVTDGAVTELPVHLRGSHLTLDKERVPRRFPRVLTRSDAPTVNGKQSGRLQLAEWLVRRDHPLTSRVMVNRIWRWHFGKGIVPSPDNFGKLGEPPVNPPLLDWLAVRFVEGGWSVKALHRLILLSSTYQMSTAFDAHAAEKDPENRLQWRADVRRLEAEAIRDSLLFVSGLLDPSRGGSLLHVKNREFLFDHTSKDTTKYDSRRRAVYLPVIRNHLYDVFQLFDFTDATVSSGDRTTTTVAPQALFLMNSDLVAQASESLAANLLRCREGDDAGRIQRLYAKAYGRPAQGHELARAQSLLAELEGAIQGREANADRRRLQAWSFLCQVVLAANEFVYTQ